jgi:hypothetical protein
MERNRDVVVRFVRANYAATRWSLDPANREEAVALLMTQPNTDRSLSEQLYNVLKLREEFGGFDAPQNLRRLTTPSSGLYDLSYLRAALHHDGRGDDDTGNVR